MVEVIIEGEEAVEIFEDVVVEGTEEEEDASDDEEKERCVCEMPVGRREQRRRV